MRPIATGSAPCREVGERPSGRSGGGPVAETKLKALGAAIFSVSSERISPGESTTTQRTRVVASFVMYLVCLLASGVDCVSLETYTINVSIEVGFSLELLGTWSVPSHICAWMRVFAIRVVCF